MFMNQPKNFQNKYVQNYYKNPYWIDSFNKRYEEDINKDIELLLEKLFIKWKNDYQEINNKDIEWPNDIKLYKKFMNDINYMVNIKIKSIINKINTTRSNYIEPFYYENSEDLIIINSDIYPDIDDKKHYFNSINYRVEYKKEYQNIIFNNFIKYYIKNKEIENCFQMSQEELQNYFKNYFNEKKYIEQKAHE